MVILPDVLVNRAGGAVRIVVVADRNDKTRIPAFYEAGNIRFRLPCVAKIADHREDDVCGLGGGIARCAGKEDCAGAP